MQILLYPNKNNNITKQSKIGTAIHHTPIKSVIDKSVTPKIFIPLPHYYIIEITNNHSNLLIMLILNI